MAEELPDSHRIELKKSRELLYQLKVLKDQPGWIYLCRHIKATNDKRRALLAEPAYNMEKMQSQNYEKGILIGSEMFAAGVDLEINRLTENIQVLERTIGDEDELDTEE